MFVAATFDVTPVTFLQHRIPSPWPDATPRVLSFLGGHLFIAFVTSFLTFHLLLCESLHVGELISTLQDALHHPEVPLLLLMHAPVQRLPFLINQLWLDRHCEPFLARPCPLLRTHSSQQLCMILSHTDFARQTLFCHSPENFL